MKIVVTASLVMVAVLHLWLVVVSMVLWSKPMGLAFTRWGSTRAEQSKALASHLGLHQGFIAVGLLWSAWLGSSGVVLALFFLACAIAAGVHAAASIGRKYFFVQTLPAALALGLMLVVSSR